LDGSLFLVVPLFFLLEVLLVALLQHGVLFAEVLEFEGEGDHAHEELVVDFVLLVVVPEFLEVLQQLLLLDLDAHVLKHCLEAQLADHLLLTHRHAELLLQLHQLPTSVQLVQRDVLGTVKSPVLSHFLDRLLEDGSGVFEANLVESGKDIRICEVLLPLNLDRGGVFDFGVNTGLGGIVDPLAHEDLVLLAEEVGALSFALVVDPVPLEVVAAAFGEHSVAAALAHVPHALVDVAVGVDHPALAVGLAVHPHAVVSVAVPVEHGASALLGVVLPVAGVLAAQLVLGVGHPEGALAVALVASPAALVLVAVGVVLYPEAVLLVVLPVADVLVRPHPLVGLLGAVLVERLLLNAGRATFTQ